MEFIRKINRHEMLRRWAVGEIESDFFGGAPRSRQSVNALLESGEPNREIEGIQIALSGRMGYIDSLPWDIEWHITELNMDEKEFQRIQTINRWHRPIAESQLLSDAARYLIANPGVDPRVTSVIARFPDIPLTGITLIGMNVEEMLTIAEGTARMVALYKHHVFDRASVERVEVVLGLSQTKWSWS